MEMNSPPPPLTRMIAGLPSLPSANTSTFDGSIACRKNAGNISVK
jgi:hypothetical protein